MKTKLIAVVSSVLLVVGCQSFQSIDYNKSLGLKTPAPLEIISQESQRAVNAQLSLLKYNQSYSDTLDTRQKSFESDAILVDYIGKPQSVLSSIGIKYGYRYLERCNPQQLPTVNFTNYVATPEEIVVFIDAQIKKQADIAINKQDKTIVLFNCK